MENQVTKKSTILPQKTIGSKDFTNSLYGALGLLL